MARKPMNAEVLLLGSLDVGNGEAKGVSTAGKELVSFEPVIAPMSKKRGLSAEEKPYFSLRLADNSKMVYGVDDVFAYGQRENIRRLNSTERYTTPDYFNMVDVLLLHLFREYRGLGEYIKPVLAMAIPVEQYNNENIVEEIKSTLLGKRYIVDADACELHIQINSSNLHIIPESSGAMVHYAFDPETLKRRGDTGGSTLVIDPGYETTDTTLFEGMKYQRDRAFTFRRTGMGSVTRAVGDYVRTVIRDADDSRVDVAMRAIAGIKPGAAKVIEPTPGKRVDISPVYDDAIANLAQRIAQDVQTAYTEDVSRVLLSGGGAYHLSHALRDQMRFHVEIAPTPEYANVYGALTTLKIKAESGR
jgi:hypothetical protein